MRSVLTIGIAAVMMAMGAPAQAEPYVTFGAGTAQFRGPDTDGTWEQQLLSSRHGIPAVQQTKESFVWDAGVGYRFAGGDTWWEKLWSIEAGFRSFGSGVSAGGLAVSDAQYTKIMNGADEGKFHPSRYEATTHMQGGYVRVSKGFDTGTPLEPYLSVGFTGLGQRTDYWSRGLGAHAKTNTGAMNGMVAGPTFGGGVRFDLYHGIKLLAGAELQQMVTESGHAISSRWILVEGGVQVPLVWPFD